jgi:glutathionylspermidine synthase
VRRERLAPRVDWRAKVEALGLVWHSVGSAPYWNEAAVYSFTAADVAAIDEATRALYGMFLDAGDYILAQGLLDRFDIPPWCQPLIETAWRAEPPALNYGRFDLGYDGRGPPKLFEFNCDTPTSLLEAAVVQWFWKEEVFPAAGQFNGLHEALLAKWSDIAPLLRGGVVHFAHADFAGGEDMLTTAYMMDLAREAGLTPRRLTMRDIGWRASDRGGAFVGLENEPIHTCYKLYPWEWMVGEAFGRNLALDLDQTLWIEPIWKMIWSNKAILPILWDLFPRHPNLLWARTDAPASDTYVQKPALAREGGNVTVVKDGAVLARTEGPYTGRTIWQDYFELPSLDGATPVIGSWCVDGEPAGMGVREDGLVTGNLARFVPHILV